MRALTFTIAATLSAMLAATPAAAATECDATWIDAGRNRAVPVRIRMPDGTGKVPAILFSHGLGGSLDAGTLWAKSWVDAGFAVVNLQHKGSDIDAVRAAGVAGLGDMMSGEQLAARALDVRFVIDGLAVRPREGACDLARIDLRRIGMAGHSFGAHTTLAVAGQSYGAAARAPFADVRIRAAIAFSPAPPTGASGAGDDTRAFGTIRVPVMSITGTSDSVRFISPITPADRTRPFRAMPPGDKYLLVFLGGTHAMFGGREKGALRGTAVPVYMRDAVIRASTLFWRYTLNGDAAAKRELDATTLGKGDVFEKR